MPGGAFDDRNDVRLCVKLWLRQHEPNVYAPDPIRRLVAESINNDRDPVDSLADSWREASYGAIMGIVEFASEELNELASVESSNSSLQSASKTAGAALSCLPYDPAKMRCHIDSASLDLHEAREMPGLSASPASNQAARALQALSLAKDMLRN